MSRIRMGGVLPWAVAALAWSACQGEPEPTATSLITSSTTEQALTAEQASAAEPSTAEARLGRFLFFDPRLSEPAGQACATCHGPGVGFTGPSQSVNHTTVVYPGAVPGRFGNRKPPSAAYAAAADVFAFDPGSRTFSGGNFWDGRATGVKLGSPSVDQAQGPFLNPLEQNNPDAATVVRKVCAASYAPLFLEVWGKDACADPAAAFDAIAKSIAAYEASPSVSAFSSKFDAWTEGRANLTAPERRGFALFKNKAKCALCHPPPMFTDFTFENIGVPRNPSNPFYAEADINPQGADWVDPGLGGFLASQPQWAGQAALNLGKMKVPTLRNVDKRPSRAFVKAYGHNGYFKSLEAVVHFYNTRDLLPACAPGGPSVAGKDCWPEAEVPQTVNREELGHLGLTPGEEADLVAFLGTLSDGYRAGAP